ncbi:hypothetical protein LTR08_009123 [Meristemomyces frigidus]|nr:hypothetical protein LTR08_009123 [Meristemomyces frigidus]
MATTIDNAALFKVDGLVAVITGGGSGLGEMMAIALASAGAKRVYIIGRRLEKLQEVASNSSHANIIVPVQGDVTSKDSLAKVVEQVEKDVGYVNLLVVNSGMSGPSMRDVPEKPTVKQIQEAFWSWSTEDFNSVYALNNTAAFFTAAAFLNLLDVGNQAGKGPDYQTQVLFTSSLAGLSRNLSTGVAYATSKAGTVHLAKTMATFLAPHNIRVNTLAPGIFPSEMTAGKVGASAGFSTNTIPAGRLGSEEDIRGTVLWLVSRAGAYINGMVILCDGGRLSLQPSVY